MQARLLYVMDPMCSWCWGFAPVAEALAAQAAASGVPMYLVVGGLRRDRIAIDSATRVRYLSYWQAVNAGTGQLFNFDDGLPEGMLYDTEAACRAVVTVRHLDPPSAWPMARRIQQAFYQEGADVTKASVLVLLAEEVGIPRIEFAEAFDSSEQQLATAADFSWVQDLGIAGFPTLLAERDGQLALLTNGYQPLDALSPLLGRWLERAVDG
ncbi:DsbA family protein [Phytopseudomonas dryadis]|uniref:Disulfide bond formation protein DsbA n=1 Tax=Phytopseudomonas dryadis TaxID=2487520 RepID=A0A4Q9QXC1_9GAMM|nr:MULTISPECIES: DsbA family protein [Pseudomonas]TBU87365.1 disulfide bond formation protein DsbA [Pseudomonas dryadis]TBV09447.1 disulfide bond formation protein DsbA [Pseudomonas dryadis]TBV13360.1 disulfide bond formation protein DsbA [Pseudomonas sp. FRB 230]